ncbi:bifunctional hydroxymethylpyrimidine kinase/phosphomethylpyrimidine kinase [Halosimplex aquaticum]|uniref:Bifunctional hydroxymethylpyrimidine kinase/phosphomethylpyrimidine kinase n=1 Tax=Halosimplex aquaticum TaxID=3026162 RepID=A0ABD5XUW5_9EURY|nr:bifunctional hydroxymethylpyrimidine kinase/phosphomethylpyrimidine kinase [Halosimplex aquaticum]
MTRQEAPVTPPVVLAIAGSDSGGGAGVQADLKTIEAGGAFGATAITSVTAQNTTGVESTHVLPTEEIDAQCEAVCTDLDVAAVKTGMLATAEVVELVTEQVRDLNAPAVIDPVMVAASGDRLLASEAESAYERLIAEATLVTPNADEAAVLTGVNPESEAEAREAGERLVDAGADAALVKGGHVPGDDVVDVLVTGERVETFRHPRVDTDATHGSGCTLSSAIAARLAHGDDLVDAAGAGIDLLGRAVRYNLDVGEGPGAVHHAVELRDRAARDATAEAVESVVQSFVDRNVGPLVPEVGINVAGATPYAERPDETAAVEGRITRTLSGAQPNRGVRFGASTHVARLLLAARERDPALRFAANCRYDDEVAAALDDLDGPAAEYDTGEASRNSGGFTVESGVEAAFDSVEGTPSALVDRGAYGDEPLVFVLAREPDALVDRTLTLLEAVESGEE